MRPIRAVATVDGRRAGCTPALAGGARHPRLDRVGRDP